MTPERVRDLVERADAYILALRQVLYSRKPDVRRLATGRLDEHGSAWVAAREGWAEAQGDVFTQVLGEALKRDPCPSCGKLWDCLPTCDGRLT